MTREEILRICDPNNLYLLDPNSRKKLEEILVEMSKDVKLDFSNMDLQKFIEETTRPDVRMYCGVNPLYETDLRPHMICGNGVRLSIQASSTHYCLPREDWLDKYDSYEMVIMSPCNLKELLSKQKKLKLKEAVQWFIDNDPRPESFDCEASEEEWDMFPEPFGFVPHDALQGLIDACGGIKGIRECTIDRE